MPSTLLRTGGHQVSARTCMNNKAAAQAGPKSTQCTIRHGCTQCLPPLCHLQNLKQNRHRTPDTAGRMFCRDRAGHNTINQRLPIGQYHFENTCLIEDHSKQIGISTHKTREKASRISPTYQQVVFLPLNTQEMTHSVPLVVK